MIISIRDAGTEDFRNTKLDSITVNKTVIGDVFGSVEGGPDSEVVTDLLNGKTVDLEFARAWDEDAEVVTLSGVVMTSREFGSGVGHEEPKEWIGFQAAACVIED